MTREELARANEIECEIRKLDNIIYSAQKTDCKLIHRKRSFIFKTRAYGYMDSVEYDMDREIEAEVIKILSSRRDELQRKLENIGKEGE